MAEIAKYASEGMDLMEFSEAESSVHDLIQAPLSYKNGTELFGAFPFLLCIALISYIVDLHVTALGSRGRNVDQ